MFDNIYATQTRNNGSHIFVTGGRNTDNFFGYNSLVIYDIDKNTWTIGPNFTIARFVHYCEFSFDNNALYIFGGAYEDGISTSLIDSIEKYDILTQTWTVLDERLSVARCGGHSILYDNYIWIFGGETDVLNRNSTGVVDIFDLNSETIIDNENNDIYYPSNDYGFGLVLIGDNIYSIGGRHHRTTIRKGVIQPINITSTSTAIPTATSTITIIVTVCAVVLTLLIVILCLVYFRSKRDNITHNSISNQDDNEVQLDEQIEGMYQPGDGKIPDEQASGTEIAYCDMTQMNMIVPGQDTPSKDVGEGDTY